jgi:hypothetical protein
MALSQEITAFVQAAVRLPGDRLRSIDRDWERLSPHRAVVTELVQGSETVRQDVSDLRAYVLAEARRSAADRAHELLIPEDIYEAVFPAARALLLRKVMENSADPRRAQAYAALTRPFADILG